MITLLLTMGNQKDVAVCSTGSQTASLRLLAAMMLVATNGDLTVREFTTFFSHVYFKLFDLSHLIFHKCKSLHTCTCWASSHNDPKSAEVTNTFLSCQCFDFESHIHFFKEELNDNSIAYHE